MMVTPLEHQQRYQNSDKGRAKRRAWDQSEIGKAGAARRVKSETGKSSVRRYRATENGRRAIVKAAMNYRSSRKGRIAHARARAKRKGIPCEQYAVLRADLHDGRVCYNCCTTQATEIDHVLPIGLARHFDMIDIVDQYVAPICGPCHKIKSRMDRADIRRLALPPRLL